MRYLKLKKKKNADCSGDKNHVDILLLNITGPLVLIMVSVESQNTCFSLPLLQGLTFK